MASNGTRNKPTGFKPVTLHPKTPNQRRYIESILYNDITFATGPAGTGKTHIAVGMAVQMLREGYIDKIVLTRPLVQVGRDMGYLPGDIGSKVGPYIQPCFDELRVYLSEQLERDMRGRGLIEIVPLSIMRGRTFNNSFIILDEAQNVVRVEMKNFLTRIGEGSKIVVMGDIDDQSDLKEFEQGCFEETIRRLNGMDGFEHVSLGRDDIVRHELIGEIIDRLW